MDQRRTSVEQSDDKITNVKGQIHPEKKEEQFFQQQTQATCKKKRALPPDLEHQPLKKKEKKGKDHGV